MKNPRKTMIIGAAFVIIGLFLSIILEVLFVIRFGLHWYPNNTIEYNSDQTCVFMIIIGALLMLIGMFGLMQEEAEELVGKNNNTDIQDFTKN